MSSGDLPAPSHIVVKLVVVVLWLVALGALPLGIAVIHSGLGNLHREQPYCYGVAMSRGDTCRIDEYRVHRSNDYDGQLDYEHHGARLQIGLGAVLSGVGAVFLVVAVFGRSSRAKPARTLDDLLMAPAQAGRYLGVSNLELTAISDALLDDSASLAEQDCLAAFAPAQLAAYGQTGWTGARIHTLTENTDGRPGTRVVQIVEAVIAFPSRAEAKQAKRAQAKLWAAADRRTATFRDGSRVGSWLFGPFSTDGLMLGICRMQQDGSGWAAQRALAVRGTVVIDVQVSGPWSGTIKARGVLEQIATGVTMAAITAPDR